MRYLLKKDTCGIVEKWPKMAILGVFWAFSGLLSQKPKK